MTKPTTTTTSTTTTTTTTTTPTTNNTTTNPQQPHKRRRRRSATKPAKLPTPPTSSEIDHWFQSGPFSALPQGASPAEIEADLKRIRASIARLANILLGAAVGSGGFSPVCEAQKEKEAEEEALFVRGMSLSPRKESGRGLSPGTAAEPLTPESFYGEDTMGEREKERKRKARREAEAARVRSPTQVRREKCKGPGGVPAKRHRARFSPYMSTTT